MLGGRKYCLEKHGSRDFRKHLINPGRIIDIV